MSNRFLGIGFLIPVFVLAVSSLAPGMLMGDESEFDGSHPVSLSGSDLVREGETRTIYQPHHEVLGGSHNSHFFATTGDTHHFAWFGSTPASSSPIIVRYDFRNIGSFSNSITTAQRARVLDALNNWTDSTNGKLQFVQDTVAAASAIINIGTGNLAAVGSSSGPGGVLGIGGGSFNHSGGHLITAGVAWQDSAENWDTIIGNGNPSGTFDYFTVAAQEIGHALGLGHASGAAIMNGSYSGERTFTQTDVDHIQSVYGFNSIPEPASGILFVLAGIGMGCCRRGRRVD